MITARAMLASAMVLGGCATPAPPNPDALSLAGPQPSAAQADAVIRAYLGRTLKDPDSLKQFAITRGPYEKTYRVLVTTEWRKGYVVCFEYNAKNSYGGYVGLRPGAITLQGLDSGPVMLDVLPDFALHLYC